MVNMRIFFIISLPYGKYGNTAKGDKKMKLIKRLFAAVLALCIAVPVAACSASEPSDETQGDDTSGGATVTYSHEFNEQVQSWEKKSNAKFGVSYYTATAVYCSNPTHPGTQSVTLYVPLDYLNEDGTVNTENTVGGFTAETAPIIYWNSHGSYIGMGPFTINGMSTRSTQYGWVINMINEGFVVCMVGERGKTTTDENGNLIGKGPVAIADLKAGVRFLKHNDDVIPGSSDRIVSVGTSSGGAMSALLGTSGNNSYYDSYLEEMGAVMDETDDVFATQAYCPITDLAHADYAYEWMFGQDDSELSDFQKALSKKLAAEYVTYINGLGLKDEEGNPLTLAEDGSKSGSYYDWLIGKYEESFEDYAQNFETDYASYATAEGKKGAADADDYDWLSYDVSSGKATFVTPEGYDSALDALILEGYCPRQKSCTSFDSLDPIGTDNDVFGKQGGKEGAADSARHFNQRIAEMIGELQEEFPEEYALYYDSFYNDSHIQEVEEWNIYLNSYSFLIGAAEGDVSPNFRINMGAQDADTSITVSATLALLLAGRGVNTEFNIMWAWGHNDVDTPTGLTEWVKSICQ